MKKKKIRAAGDVLLDMEPLLFELAGPHGLQKGEILALISVWVDIHAPEAIEKYIEDGSSPVFRYGAPRK